MEQGVPYNAGVRRLTFQPSFCLLACVALLLIVAAPLVSRWQAQVEHGAHAREVSTMMESVAQMPGHIAHPGHDHDTHHHDMSSHQAMVDVPVAAPDTPAPRDPHADHEMGVDCDYCLIAARMISLLVALLLLLTTWPAVFRALAGLVDTRRAPVPGTLGARGPPAALAC